ncbi:MAG TPA: hypothetical protein VH352_28250 [Pseudonocardiaceae bacterium]|nr:hypothetical protein [Pseudonocardiaceae bacterium]
MRNANGNANASGSGDGNPNGGGSTSANGNANSGGSASANANAAANRNRNSCADADDGDSGSGSNANGSSGEGAVAGRVTTRPASRRSRSKALRALAPLPWLLPALVLIGGVGLWPVEEMVRTSFLRIGTSGYVRGSAGWSKYVDLLREPALPQVVLRTVAWVVVVVVATVVISLLLAQLLNRRFVGRTVVRWALIVPWAASVVMSSIIFKWLLDWSHGVLNTPSGQMQSNISSTLAGIPGNMIVGRRAAVTACGGGVRPSRRESARPLSQPPFGNGNRNRPARAGQPPRFGAEGTSTTRCTPGRAMAPTPRPPSCTS